MARLPTSKYKRKPGSEEHGTLRCDFNTEQHRVLVFHQ